MSEHWTLRCLDHDAIGPDIRRSHGYHIWGRADTTMPGPEQRAEWAQEAWYEFMREHRYCDLRLVHEVLDGAR